MFFCVISKNSNWKILTKKLVTFQRKDGVKDEKLSYFWGSWKTLIFRGGFTKNQYRGRDCLKGRTWTVCRFRGWGQPRKRGWYF